ncbi:endothelin-converting enzyme 1, partial [Plakobranchus ocellatus]
ILQFPIYDAGQPHSSTFGSLGSLLGMYLHRFVDDWGRRFDKDGQMMDSSKGGGTWWSNSSVTAYKEVKQCVAN